MGFGEGCLTCPGGDVTPGSLVGDSGGCNNSIFFRGKNCKKQGGGKSHSFGFSLHRFFEMVRKMEGTRDGSRSNKEKMPFKCATRRHFRLISAYAETASSPGGISISHETLIRFASLATHPFHFPHFTKGGSRRVLNIAFFTKIAFMSRSTRSSKVLCTLYCF